VIAEGCRREGLFDAAGGLIEARFSASPTRLLAAVFALASSVTFVLGLDATAVLVTPVVITLTARRRAGEPALYATAHLANSASLLLPVSNLTNLLALRASGLPFTRFALLMALPTAAVIAVEWGVLRAVFSRTLTGAEEKTIAATPLTAPTMPRYPVIVLALTLIGFGLTSLAQISAVWVATAGALAITLPALPGLAHQPRQLAGVLRAAQPGFLVFVLALGAIVAAAADHGLASAARSVLPTGGDTLPTLLAVAGVSAVLANAVNNLPATLILLPVVSIAGPGQVLAMLIGVNVGPNITPAGSLATLLWRRTLDRAGIRTSARELVRLGALTAIPSMLAATAALWLALKL
jgi:arsenical pump membrane protein